MMMEETRLNKNDLVILKGHFMSARQPPRGTYGVVTSCHYWDTPTNNTDSDSEAESYCKIRWFYSADSYVRQYQKGCRYSPRDLELVAKGGS